MELDEEGSVLSLDCDCPYDYGPVCKHLAAVLLMLADQAVVSRNPQNSKLPMGSQKDLKELLNTSSKEKLISMILSLVAESDALENRVRLHLSQASGKEVLQECRKLIRSYLDSNSDDDGFISRRRANNALKGVELVMKKARDDAEDGNHIGAVSINLCIMEELSDMLQVMDDSDGMVGDVFEECMGHLREA